MVARARERLRALEARWLREVDVYRAKLRERLDSLGERLQAAGPDAVLKRGFVILWDEQHRPVTTRANVQSGQKLTAQWRDGEAPLRAE
jgi:exonuclease VII large subunit